MVLTIKRSKITRLLIAILTVLSEKSETHAQIFAPDAEKSACPSAPRSQNDLSACQGLNKKYPKDPDLYFNIANYLIEHNAQDKSIAKSWYRKGIEIAPNYYRSYSIEGFLANEDGDTGKAIAALNKALERNPRYTTAFRNRGVVYYRNNQYDKAIADFSEAIKLDPNDAIAFMARGNAWANTGYNDKAIIDFNESIRLGPKHAEAFRNRGVVWYRNEQYNKAIADLSEAIKLDPNDAIAFMTRGNAWSDKGYNDKAMADFNEAIRLDPKEALVYLNRGIVWSDKGYQDKAITDFNKSIRLAPKYAEAFTGRGVAWYRNNQYDKAIADFSEAIKLDPNDAHAFLSRGNAWSDKGYNDKAMADFNEAIRLDPKEALSYLNRGIAWYRNHQYDKAITDFNTVKRLDPNNRNVIEQLKLALEKKKRLEARAANTKQQQSKSQNDEFSPSIGKRVALVIGNGYYKNLPTLDNPARDAELLGVTLRDIGFDEVIIKLNLTRQGTLEALTEFEKVASSASWATIYFAGHGIEVDGMNYLLPVDAKAIEQNSISTQTVNLEYFLNAAETGEALRLVIIDACRNNPFAQQIRTASASRGIGELSLSSIGKGLGRVEPDPGTLVIYAAKHGQEALDGEGKNSPFVEALVKRIKQKPAVEVRRLFDYVREDVVKATNNQQQPFAYGSLSADDDFYFTSK